MFAGVKLYFEITDSSFNGMAFALCQPTRVFDVSIPPVANGTAQDLQIDAFAGNNFVYLNGSAVPGTWVQQNNGGWWGLAIDAVNHWLWIYESSTSQWNRSPTANPSTGVGGISISALNFALTYYATLLFQSSSGITQHATINFGATAFNGTVPTGFVDGNTATIPPAASVIARQPGYDPAPQGPGEQNVPGVIAWTRKIVDVTNRSLNGKLNATLAVTMAPGTSTTVIDPRISAFSALPLTPLTAHAAALVNSIYVSSQQAGQATFTYTSTANTDAQFRLTIIG